VSAPKLDAARDWLCAYLTAQSDPVPSEQVRQAARVAAHAASSLHHVMRPLGVVSEARGLLGERYWSLTATPSLSWRDPLPPGQACGCGAAASDCFSKRWLSGRPCCASCRHPRGSER